MKNTLLLLSFLVGSVATMHASSFRNTNAPIEGAAVGVDVGGGRAGVSVDADGDDDDGDGYYDDGYYDDGVVWTGPGQYYGTWFNNESDYVTWRRNYYWRPGRGAIRGGRGYNRGVDRGYRGGDGYRGGGGRGGRGGGGGRR